jgi:hypothetical protein
MALDNFGGEAEPPARVPLPSSLQWVVVAAVALLLALAAFVGGWLVGKNAPRPSRGAYIQPIAAAPADWTEWKYPNAQENSGSSTGISSVGNSKVGALQTYELTTPDRYEQVLAHYANHLDLASINSLAGSGSGTGNRFTPNGMELYGYSDVASTRSGIQEKLITYRTSTYSVVIHVSRLDTEKQTRIVISYMPNP